MERTPWGLLELSMSMRGMDLPKHGQKVSRAPQGSRRKESSSLTAFQQGRAASREITFLRRLCSDCDRSYKSYDLEKQGLLPGATDSLNIALSDDMENVMIPSEMCDALLRRASLLLSSKGRQNVDATIPDLQKCLQITPDNPKVL
ncbi:hypothetical protein GOP47_0010322 [Adiantum capillus-veneris]|uniref:Uncharacterized protein n=1 Tax=Adiantum capillus-veneris TaxID=13818 RepID=A0A9D4UUJ5_ADICA|nr:hypothetical protein GOP47_0010322 [Adiantum capillus-veneris]